MAKSTKKVEKTDIIPEAVEDTTNEVEKIDACTGTAADAPKKIEKKVTVILPKNPLITGTESEQEFFSVNGKNYLVQTDTPVDLPAPLAEVVMNVAKGRRAAAKYATEKAFKDSKPPVA